MIDARKQENSVGLWLAFADLVLNDADSADDAAHAIGMLIRAYPLSRAGTGDSLIVIVGGRLVGVAMCPGVTEGHGARLEQLYVAKAFRSKGMASALVNQLINLSPNGLHLTTSTTDLDGFYSRLGFSYVKQCPSGEHTYQIGLGPFISSPIASGMVAEARRATMGAAYGVLGKRALTKAMAVFLRALPDVPRAERKRIGKDAVRVGQQCHALLIA